mgnify:CR=1 FL=1
MLKQSLPLSANDREFVLALNGVDFAVGTAATYSFVGLYRPTLVEAAGAAPFVTALDLTQAQLSPEGWQATRARRAALTGACSSSTRSDGRSSRPNAPSC